MLLRPTTFLCLPRCPSLGLESPTLLLDALLLRGDRRTCGGDRRGVGVDQCLLLADLLANPGEGGLQRRQLLGPVVVELLHLDQLRLDLVGQGRGGGLLFHQAGFERGCAIGGGGQAFQADLVGVDDLAQ